MLGIHASAERVRELVADAASPADVQAALVGYLRAMLDWQRQNGFFGAYGVGKRIVYDNFIYGSDAEEVQAALKKFAGRRHAARAITSGGPQRVVGGRLQSSSVCNLSPAQLFGTNHRSRGEIEKKIFLRLPPASELTPWAQP